MAYSDVVLADSPTLYWRLNDSGGSVVDSSAGGTHTGAFHGTVTKSVIPGALVPDSDACMTFDGSTGYIDTASLGITGTFSVETWVFKPTAGSWSGGNEVVVAPADVDGVYLAVNGGHPYFSVKIATVQQTIQDGGAVLSKGVWHHIVGTWDGATLVLYVDGATNVSLGSLSGAVTTGAETFKIGSWNGTALWFNGNLDEVAAYPTGLSATQVLRHYNVGITAEPPRVLGGSRQAVQRASYY